MINASIQNMGDDLMKRNIVLTVGAHPADFTNAAGTLANHIRNGDKVFLAILTHGINSHFRNTDFRAYLTKETSSPSDIFAKLKMEKKRETKEAATVLGIEESNIRFLDYDDGPLLVEKKIIYDLAVYIREVRPNMIILHLPTENDHEDHQSAGDIGTRAIKAAANYIPQCNLPNYAVKNVFFMMPNYINKYRSFGHVLQAPDVVINIEDTIDLKREACTKFVSQKYTSEWAKKIWDCVSGIVGIMHGFEYGEAFISMNPVVSKLLPEMITRTIYDWEDDVYSSKKC